MGKSKSLSLLEVLCMYYPIYLSNWPSCQQLQNQNTEGIPKAKELFWTPTRWRHPAAENFGSWIACKNSTSIGRHPYAECGHTLHFNMIKSTDGIKVLCFLGYRGNDEMLNLLQIIQNLHGMHTWAANQMRQYEFRLHFHTSGTSNGTNSSSFSCKSSSLISWQVWHGLTAYNKIMQNKVLDHVLDHVLDLVYASAFFLHECHESKPFGWKAAEDFFGFVVWFRDLRVFELASCFVVLKTATSSEVTNSGFTTFAQQSFGKASTTYCTSYLCQCSNFIESYATQKSK